MIDLAYTKAEKGQVEKQYPWGLEITLEQEEIEKLVLKPQEVGAELRFSAISVVTEVTHSVQSGKDRACVTLQIQQLSLD